MDKRESTASVSNSPIRAGVVSYLNARPLIEGLGDDQNFDLTFDVPAALGRMLETDAADVALVPVVDTIRPDRVWPIVSDACIGSDGATLTVRVFSRVDPADITTLHVDGHSHTSVVLASVLWREKHGRALEIVPFDAEKDPASCQAVLLIGDKVIRPPAGIDVFSTQIDLGAAWKSLTGLPFVFAVWATTARAEYGNLGAKLNDARDLGVARAAAIAVREGPALGWPADLARHYLTQNLCFTMTDRHRKGMMLFLDLARHHKLLAAEPEFVFT